MVSSGLARRIITLIGFVLALNLTPLAVYVATRYPVAGSILIVASLLTLQMIQPFS